MDATPAQRLVAALHRLHAEHDLRYLKLGTEAEALSFGEIETLRAAVPSNSPLKFFGKIGGPEARNDLLEMAAIGLDGYVAPMVESAYALTIFVGAVNDVVGDATVLGINVETALAVDQLDAMLAAPASEALAFLNVGRSDLAASIGGQVDDQRVTQMTCSVIERAHRAGLKAHVGGRVTPVTLAPVLEHQQPDGFHTRFLGFEMTAAALPASAIRGALAAEIDLLQLLASSSPARAALHEQRIAVTRARLAE